MKPVKKIDLHTHLFAHPTLPHTGGSDGFLTPDTFFSVYEPLNIERSVLLPLVSPEFLNAFQSNEEVHALVRRFPDRLSWFCNVDPRNALNSPKADLCKNLAAYQAMGAKGVGEITANLPFDHPMVFNLFAACQELDMPVLFHVAPQSGECYGLIDDVGLPLLEKALQSFPRLIFIGHSQPFWAEISSDVTASNRNSYPEGDVLPGRLVSLMRRYENLHADLSAGSGQNAMMRSPAFSYGFLEEFQDRVYYGTDICTKDGMFTLAFWLDEAAARGDISEAAYIKICRGNGLRLLK